MMRKEEVDRFALKRPFEPFEIRLVDGQRFRFNRVEEFLVGRHELVTMNRRGSAVFIGIGMISTIGPPSPGARRRPRGGPKRR